MAHWNPLSHIQVRDDTSPNTTTPTNETIAEEDECGPLKGPNFDPTSPDFHNVVFMFNVTVALSLLATVASFWLCFRHFQHYFQPQYQRWIVRILLMVPVYAFASCLSFRFYWYTPYIEVVRDSYEAFVLYSFYTLLLNYLGPNLDAQHARMQGKRPMKYPVPFCCFWYNPAGYAFLLNTRWLVLQYVVVRPLTTILAMIMSQFGVLCPNSGSPAHGEFWITYANMISSTFAMYGLFTFYIVIKDDVQEWRPLWKIIAVKFIVFFTFWQGLVLDGLISLGYLKSTSIYYDTEDEADMIKSFLVCIEMLVAAALHIKAFPYTEFSATQVSRRGSVVSSPILAAGSVAAMNATAGGGGGVQGPVKLRTRVLPALLDALSPMHILRDITEAPAEVRRHRKRRKERRARRALEEFGDVFDQDTISMVDVDLGKSPTRRGSTSSRRVSVGASPLGGGAGKSPAGRFSPLKTQFGVHDHEEGGRRPFQSDEEEDEHDAISEGESEDERGDDVESGRRRSGNSASDEIMYASTAAILRPEDL